MDPRGQITDNVGGNWKYFILIGCCFLCLVLKTTHTRAAQHSLEMGSGISPTGTYGICPGASGCLLGAVALFCTVWGSWKKKIDRQASSEKWLPLLLTAGQELSFCNWGWPSDHQVWDRQERGKNDAQALQLSSSPEKKKWQRSWRPRARVKDIWDRRGWASVGREKWKSSEVTK